MISFLTDENVFPNVVALLRSKGFDVKDAREADLGGTSDEHLLETANAESRTLVTFDKYFADVLQHPLDSHHGIIRIRIHPPLPSTVLHALERFLQQYDLTLLKGTLVLLERDGYRVRRTHEENEQFNSEQSQPL
jgi:predicted nuclease of predicted toxin-antitoxin system